MTSSYARSIIVQVARVDFGRRLECRLPICLWDPGGRMSEFQASLNSIFLFHLEGIEFVGIFIVYVCTLLLESNSASALQCVNLENVVGK